jgi:hypothetical protein
MTIAHLEDDSDCLVIHEFYVKVCFAMTEEFVLPLCVAGVLYIIGWVFYIVIY